MVLTLPPLWAISLAILGGEPGAGPPTTDGLVVPEGFEATLFASDPAIAKPIQMNFDARGRLWLACSRSYPQLRPEAEPSDRIHVLEDQDGDGKAESSRVFAEGLLIPTGIEPGEGGVYVGQSTELVHLSDADGDGRADRTRVVLSGFGTEDTHHLVHTLRWGPEGLLYFAQSIYIHSHVETPWGVRRLNGGGFWQLRTDRLGLDVFVYGMVNPWGIAFDEFGQSFGVDNDTDSIKFFLPGARFRHTPGEPHVLPGIVQGKPKYCGAEFLSGGLFPEAYRGDFVTCDFRAHRVVRYRLEEDGAGFRAVEKEPLATSTNVAFRPIDVKMGPDGALYICDWYNPIINHGEVDFRDPRRDRTHGRIWRIKPKDRKALARPALAEAPISALLKALSAEEGWTRHFASRVLAERPKPEVVPALLEWTNQQTDEKTLLRGLWLFQAQAMPNGELLARLLGATDPRVRAAAVRVLVHWRGEVAGSTGLLANAARDEHPRVRLEAVRGLATTGDATAIEKALFVLERPMDPFLDYALRLAVRENAHRWLPQAADLANAITDAGAARRWIFALLAAERPEAIAPLLTIRRRGLASATDAAAIETAAARLGGPAELRAVLDSILAKETPVRRRVDVLEALASAQRLRQVRPAGDLEAPLKTLLASADPDLEPSVLELAGYWKIEGLRRSILEIIERDRPMSRAAALEALTSLGGPASVRFFRERAIGAKEAGQRAEALAHLASLSTAEAAELAAEFLARADAAEHATALVRPFLARRDGPAELARAISERTLPKTVAEAAVREVQSGASPAPELLAAIVKAGSLPESSREPSAELIARIAQQAIQQGDPHRGEGVYRREKLRCVVCHQIKGVGGKVGPDLSTIGTSAPVDYIVESLLAPNKKVKENYHSVVLSTLDGSILTGIPEKKSQDAWVLRTAEDKRITVPARDVESSRVAASLMPVGLLDELSSGELLDLVRFLGELGKPGPWGPGEELVVREWALMGPLTSAAAAPMQESLLKAGEKCFSTPGWERSLTANAGWVYLREFTLKPQAQALFAACLLDAKAPVRVRLTLEPGPASQVWFNGAPFETTTVEGDRRMLDLALPEGTSRLLLRVDLSRSGPFLKLTGYSLEPGKTFSFFAPNAVR